ncbi:hypothetical protein MYU51_006053 [Penicillium brevicompactum]|uniref:uncharacterized protein n=1 Tax=Penicillium brevicompactum TaxID=5074 RepID=UPI002540EDE4|nr:uncharacterized protein N7506_004877 [Penicillium brevicompactum]KAJ5336855.1 hypothetical protein N7506_004877 [Penicillium brevicompactum]
MMLESEAPLHLYAELLPNIRQITIYVSLPESAAFDEIRPNVQLSESRKAITVSLPAPFQDITETMKLPARASYPSKRDLETQGANRFVKTSGGNREFSLRVHVDDNDEVLAPRDELIDDFVPWTADKMSGSTRIRCRHCDQHFLGSLSASTSTSDQDEENNESWIWKDLPSGNWAEMMDFWHCHKPDPHEGHEKDEKETALRIEDETAHTKGYGADSQVVAISGTVLVDVATFLLAESDCIGLEKGNDQEQKFNTEYSADRTLDCTKCRSIIGMEDPVANGWRLLKASVSLNTKQDFESSSPQWETHPTEVIVAAQLLELIERESARRFVVHCGQKSGLVLWVFNPDMRYSKLSADHSVMAQQAMKVFFQDTADVDGLLHPEIGNPSPLSVEEVELPSMVFEAMEKALRDSNAMLPVSARKFQEWQVGLLSRFNRGPV